MKLDPFCLMALCSALMIVSCGNDNSMPASVNKPIAQAEVAVVPSTSQVRERIQAFSRQRNFAVQEIVAQPRGNVEFTTRLFRDDISVMISRLKGEPIMLAAYPLCVCELEKRVGLREAARDAVAELREELSKR